MSTGEGNICRLCFKLAEVQCEVINDVMKMMLEVLLLQMNWDVSKNSFLCQQCTEKAKNFFYFKSTCIATEQSILSSAVDKKEKEFEMREISAGNTGLEMVGQDEFSVCRFCMTWLDRNYCIPIELLIGRSMIVEILPVFMPELDLTIIKNPVTCVPCGEKLENYFNFVLNSFEVEEKMNTHSRDKKPLSKGKGYLKNLLGYPQICDTKQELDAFDVKMNVYLEEYQLGEANVNDQEALHVKNQEVGKMLKCTKCAYETRHQRNLKKHELNHKDVSEVEIYKCTSCTYETRHRYNYKIHSLIHKDALDVQMYKCATCTYQSRHKHSLKDHMLIHKNISQVQVYKCTVCTFETVRKSALNRHMHIHKNALDQKIYKCAICTYGTIHKCNLTKHMLIIHKDDAEIYQCTVCPHRTRYKNHFKTHMLIHKDISDVEIYKCTTCTYNTRHKRYLKKHMMIHKDSSDLRIHRCAMCSYETRLKGSLKKHMLTHKDHSEVQMYKCTKCTYETKWKSTLKRHLLIHKDISEVKIYKCTMCAYETRRNCDLNVHMLKHKKEFPDKRKE